jgi:hypothetical protein
MIPVWKDDIQNDSGQSVGEQPLAAGSHPTLGRGGDVESRWPSRPN